VTTAKKKIQEGAPSRFFLPLEKGDAVVHQSDLLHGVQVTSGERWSWILWLKESGCNSDPSVWRYEEEEEKKEEKKVPAEDPISLFLQAKRSDDLATKVSLMHRSSELGFCRAHNEMGMLHLNGGDGNQAEKMFELAALCGSSDGFYNLGNRYIQKGMIGEAVESFLSGAERGSTLAMFNVGVANLKGAGGLSKNIIEARRWFERCGERWLFFFFLNISDIIDTFDTDFFIFFMYPLLLAFLRERGR
jgi:hypothetical protein